MRIEDNSPVGVGIVATPSASRPVVFLHDARTGGTSFELSLARACADLNKPTLVSAAGYSVAGTPFFVKVFSPEVRRSVACVAGHFDFRLLSTDALECGRRRCTCVVTLRHPVRRF
eukprot:CAMPEP_0175783432 /NCGR_PEP_ID=MMETSP0097-20121207/78300_1 /TAXON_ID=311494 /ORGANISM="Alexandrium monilatum, Strain CCMP3105" /LENGTH=115 /DNA_ID=CAMNT_0017094293 /DNA_START=424 /DNA_END=768 /DNA_ORIENTATION=+